MMEHRRLSLQQALLALDNDDFSDDTTGGMFTDEEDDLDRQLGLTDGVSRCVSYGFFWPFTVYMRLHLLPCVYVTKWSEKHIIFALYFEICFLIQQVGEFVIDYNIFVIFCAYFAL